MELGEVRDFTRLGLFRHRVQTPASLQGHHVLQQLVFLEKVVPYLPWNNISVCASLRVGVKVNEDFVTPNSRVTVLSS